LGEPVIEFGLELFDGQAHHVRVRPLEAGHDPVAVFLDGIGAGLVERLSGVDVGVDFLGRERLEGDIGGHGEEPFAAGVELYQADAGDDLVGAPRQGAEHAGRVAGVGRLAEQPCPQADHRVGA